MSNVGDLGRRVAERRRELGISREEVARRAGMHPAYVELIEENPAPQLTRAALWRLSAALETTVEALAGSGMLAPPGRSASSEGLELDEVEPEDAKALLASGGIGRVVFVAPRGPVAVPVNFKVFDGDIVFRTATSAAVVEAVDEGLVSFEVDHIDDALSEGWSVLVTGEGRVLTEGTELESVEHLAISPWAGGEKDRYVRITPKEITGRRIRRR